MKKIGGSNKGQVSIFIIVAIILLFIIFLSLFIFKNDKNPATSDIKSKMDAIDNTFKNCQEISADLSVIRIGMQGGYYKNPETYLDFGWFFIPYYYIEGKSYFPEIKMIENEISEAFDENFYMCIKKISSGDIKIEVEKPKTKTLIKENDEINFDTELTYRLRLEDTSRTYDISKRPLTKKYKFFEMYEVAKYISESHNLNPPMLCLDCLINMSKDRALLVDMINIENNTRLVIISEEGNLSRDYSLQFVEKFKDKGIKLTAPLAPKNGI